MAALLTSKLLRIFICSLQQSAHRFKRMNMERRRVIKQAADIAMAYAAPGARWSHVLISKQVPALAAGIVTKQKHELFCTKKPDMGPLKQQLKRKAPDRHAICRRQSNSKVRKAERLAGQHQKLSKLVPGGEFMDRVSLLSETAAYIVALQTQVRVMNHIANVLEHLNEIGKEDSPQVSTLLQARHGEAGRIITSNQWHKLKIHLQLDMRLEKSSVGKIMMPQELAILSLFLLYCIFHAIVCIFNE